MNRMLILAALSAFAFVVVLLGIRFAYWPSHSPINAAEASAVWTEVYALGSLLQLVGLAAAAIFAYGAWREAKSQAAQAKRNADAAEASLTVQREIGEAQARCYPSVQEMQVGFHPHAGHDGIIVVDDPAPDKPTDAFPVFHFTIKNHGNTPVRNLSYRMSVKFAATFMRNGEMVASERQSRRGFPFLRDEAWPDGDLIPAGESIAYRLLCRFRTDELEHAALQGAPGAHNLGVVLVLALRFRDVFGKEHFEEHCYLRHITPAMVALLTPMVRMPVVIFETQEELARRHEAKSGSYVGKQAYIIKPNDVPLDSEK